MIYRTPIDPVLMQRWRRAMAIMLAGALVAGCSALNPIPISSAELNEGLVSDRKAAAVLSEPLKGPLTVEEAVARALKFNLDRRVRLLEEAVALGQFEAGKFDMLPRLLAQAGYRWRDSELISRSRDSVTGLPSLINPAISTDRNTNTTDLGLTWNMLDFGTSYYNAKQNADRVLIAAERRRKAMHTLMQEVRSAFWRTASAQRLQNRVRETIDIAEQAIVDAGKAEAERVRAPLDSLRYQRQLLENLRLLETAQQELSTARMELAHLVNLPVGSLLLVEEPREIVGKSILDVPVGRLEEMAVRRNADVREQFHNSRIAVDETRKVITRLFPGLSFNYNIRYDSNSYLINKDWTEAGISLSYNLLNLLSGPTQVRLADAGVALADQRRMSTQLAAIAQVHIARLKYANALGQLNRAEAIANIEERISVIVSSRAAAQAQSKLEEIANRASSILGLMRRYQALAEAYTAASRLQATLGLEPEIDSIDDISLAVLTEAVRRADRNWDAARLPSVDIRPSSPAATTTPELEAMVLTAEVYPVLSENQMELKKVSSQQTPLPCCEVMHSAADTMSSQPNVHVDFSPPALQCCEAVAESPAPSGGKPTRGSTQAEVGRHACRSRNNCSIESHRQTW